MPERFKIRFSLSCMYYFPVCSIALRMIDPRDIFQRRSANADHFDPGKKQIPMSDLDLHGETKPAVASRGSTNSPANCIADTCSEIRFSKTKYTSVPHPS